MMMKTGYSASSLVAKVSMITSVLGVLLATVSAATTGWTILETGSGTIEFSGLFQACITRDNVTHLCSSYSLDDLPSWWIAIQTICIVGIMCGIACMIMVIVHVFGKRGHLIPIIAIVLAITAAVLCLAGVALYGVQTRTRNYGYSFVMETVAAMLFIFTGILIHIEKSNRR